MTFRNSTPMMLIALLTISACGSSSSDNTGGGGAVVTGPELSDIEGSSLSTSAASFQVGAAPSTSEASITVDAGFFSGDLDGTIEIFGETVTITDGAGELTTGEEVRLTFETNRAGDYAAPIDVTVSSLNDLNGEAAFVIGNETATSAINARTTGTLTYDGDFQATGSLAGSNTQTEYEGGITVVVDFVSDDADFTLDGTLDGSDDVDLTGTGLGISGNGITGSLNCTAGCSGGVGSSEVDATFYGPDAEELGGVLSIEIAVGGGDYDGVGTFVIAP